jgi:hypothetical protein
MRSLPLLLVPAIALAAPAPTQRRIAVLLVPMDKGAEAMSLKVESYMIEALKEYNGITVKTSDDLFGTPDDDEAETSLKRAETGFAESKAAFEKHDYEDAERKLRATLKEFGKAATARSGPRSPPAATPSCAATSTSKRGRPAPASTSTESSRAIPPRRCRPFPSASTCCASSGPASRSTASWST